MDPSKLPAELWFEIGKRLACRLDVASFRSVCKAWRSSLPFPTRFPLRATSPCSSNSWCVISEIETYSFDTHRSFQRGILVSVEAKAEPGKFKRRSMIPFYVKDQFFDHIPNLSLVAKSYCLRFLEPPPKERLVLRIALISSNANGRVDANYDALSEVSLVALLRPGWKLALLRLDNSEGSWETDICPHQRFIHIETCNRQLLAVDGDLRAFLMDYHSLKMTQVEFKSHREPAQIKVGKLNF